MFSYSSVLLQHWQTFKQRQHVMTQVACRTISSSSVSAQPGLATVPEGQAMNASLSSGMPAIHYNPEPLVPTEDLSNMSVEELQAELIRTRQAFHSAGSCLAVQ